MILNGVQLSPQESNLVQMVGECLTDKAIAVEMGISHETIKVYRNRIYRKLGFQPFEGNLHLKLARLVWQESNPVTRLQAMAARANEEFVNGAAA